MEGPGHFPDQLHAAYSNTSKLITLLYFRLAVALVKVCLCVLWPNAVMTNTIKSQCYGWHPSANMHTHMVYLRCHSAVIFLRQLHHS